MKEQIKKPARRYSEGKLRYELLPDYALSKIAEVYTKGAEKYTLRDDDGKVIEDGSDNWRHGMSWTKMLGSIERHIRSFRQGEDFDKDLGTYHLANAAWGLLGLLEYYKIAPQYDDRKHDYLSIPSIGLDIDEIVCDWNKGWAEKFGHNLPRCWNFSYKNKERFDTLGEDLNNFYLNLPPKISPDDLPFEPKCWITSRSVPVELTMEWLEKNGFPTVPCYSVGFGKSKVEVAKQAGIDIFVDDSFANFVELNKAGICTFLMDAPWNERYEVGYKRIHSLKELFERFK